MAGVLQKPDALSLSGNLKPFVLSSSGKIVFNLLMGSDEEIIFINNYEPGPDNTVRIDLREEMKALLAFNLDASQNSWVQTALVKDFKAVIDGQAYAFRVVGGGVADLADTPANWLSQHFLTWQPRHKRVTYYSPEWLTFYATDARTLKLKATFANGSTKQLNLLTATAGKAYTQNLQYAYVAGLLGNTYPTYYEVWTEGSGGSRSESQFYLYEEAKSADEQWFLFTNSLGGIDTIRAYGVNKLAAEHTHSLDEREEELEEYDVETDRLYVKNTGWLDDYERHWLLDFFPATRKYIYEAGALRRIVLTDSEASYTSSDLPSSYTFTYRRCEKAALLNLVKNASDIPDVITIPDTASPNFTIPPRLAEFPRATLGEGVLIPAIDPSDNTPSVTSFGQIHSVIYGDIVRAMAGQISGIVGELKVDILRTDSLAEPTDSNVFSALRTLQEIKKGQKDLDDRFLRKDIDDTAHGNISFDQTIYATGYKTGEDGTGWLIEQDGEAIFGNLFSRGTLTVVGEALIGGNLHSRDYWSGWEDGKGWQVSKAGVAELQEASIRHNIIIGNRGGSPKFISGFPNGIGWDLAPYQRINAADVAETKWRLEIDDINVRGQMRVYEFVISQLRGENDNVIFAGMMRVLKADPENEIIYLDTEKGVLYNPFRAGDILMVQRFGGMPSAANNYNVIKQYELRVKEAYVGNLSDGEERVDWIEVEKFVGDWDDVAARDVLTRVDSLTDSTRKGIVKVTTVDEIGAPYIDVVYGMKTDPDNATKVRMGNLSGVRTRNNRDLTGVWGLYAEGAVFENSTYYMQNGQTVEQNFTVLNGKLESEISTVKNDMSLEAGNILKNSSFGSNMRYWESTDEVYFILTADGYLYANSYFYVEKNQIADIVSDNGRYALRIRKTGVKQANSLFNKEGISFEGTTETDSEGNTKTIYPQFSFAFFYKPITDGTLKVGFTGKKLYAEEQLTASNSYAQYSKYAEWDGTGDFQISYTGEILIYGVSLYNDKLADAKIYLEGKITQTAEALTVDYKKLIKDGDDALSQSMTSQFQQTAEQISLRVTKETYDTDQKKLKESISSQFSVQAESISAVSQKVDAVNNTITNAGWITEATGNTLWASKTMESGYGIINTINSYIEQTAEHITISASAINLTGAVTFSMLEPGLASDTKDENGEVVKSLLALRTDLPDMSKYETAGKAEAIRNAIVNGNTEILGGYINANVIDVDNLYATHLKATVGTIGGFNIGTWQLTSKDDSGKQLMAINPSGGIYFSTADLNRRANFGIVSVDPLSGVSALAYLGQSKTDELGQTGMIVECASYNPNTPLLMKWTGASNSKREMSFSWQHIDDSYNAYMRALVKMQWLPTQAQIEKVTKNSVSKYTVYYDNNSGYLFIG